MGEGSQKPLERCSGKVAACHPNDEALSWGPGEAQVRRPVLCAQPACVPRGTEETSCYFVRFIAYFTVVFLPLVHGQQSCCAFSRQRDMPRRLAAWLQTHQAPK